MPNIPKSFLKSLDEIALANFYEAKQRYILHLGESLIMHLSSFVLAEYRDSGLTYLKVEKDIFNMKKSLSLGIYVGWIRDTAQFLAKHDKPSILNEYLTKTRPNPELSLFIISYENFKKVLESEQPEPLFEQAQKLMKGSTLKNVCLNDFLNAFVQLRNKIAHPIYEIDNKKGKGKMISWPFNDDYYRFILPTLEAAIKKVMEDLRELWEYDQCVVSEVEKNTLVVSDESGTSSRSLPLPRPISEELKVLLNSNNHLLINDWSELLKPKEEAIAEIQREQEELRKISSISELKNNITHCLDDGQISVEEFKFLESITKAKLGMSSDELRALIVQTANEMGIENPFPEVDNRFVEAIDKAIKGRSFNSLVLKLMGEQYGVSADAFEKLVDSRAYALGVSPADARKSDYHQFDTQALKLYQSLAMSRMWLMGIAKLNTGENFKIDGNSNDAGTKEYWHKFAFKTLQQFADYKLKNLQQEGGLQWTTKQNQWQIGNMTSYAWCSMFPLNAPTKAALALHISAYSSGDVAIGFLPDWKDQRDIEHFGLLQYHTRKNLRRFFDKYLSEFYKYPDLVLWDRMTETAFAPVTEVIEKHPWYFEADYSFEQIQFCQTFLRTIENPGLLSESFDIAFNLFNALIPEITQDYLLALPELNDVLALQEADIVQVIKEAKAIFSEYTSNSSDIEMETESKRGSLGFYLQEKKDGAPLFFQLRFTADYNKAQIHCDFKVRCSHNRQELHVLMEEQLSSLSLEHLPFEKLYRKSCLILRRTMTNVNAEATIILDSLRTFLQSLTERFAAYNIQVLGLRPVVEEGEAYMALANEVLDALLASEQSHFSNNLKKERNISNRLMYLDYNNSNKKHGNHWLGFGIDWRNTTEPRWIVMLHLQNTLTGAALAAKMESFAATHGYSLNTTAIAPESKNATWRIEQAADEHITASSEYNRNHAARLGRLHSEHKYANWSARTCDDHQWIQLDLQKLSHVWEIAVQGRFNREQWLTRFDVLTSENGKDWQAVAENRPGPSGCDDIVYVVFDKPIAARYVRIHAREWHGWISLRFDVKASDIEPGQLTIEKRWTMENQTAEKLTTLTKGELTIVYGAFAGEFSIK
jgi:hypothetical protein